MSYLGRYLNGEYEQVWAELLALGGTIRQEPLYSDALAVTRETMRRAKHNLELLVIRLKELNYQFEYSDKVLVATEQTALDKSAKILALLPLSLYTFYTEIGEVALLGEHPTLGAEFYSDPLLIGGFPHNTSSDYANPLFEENPTEEFKELADEEEKLEASYPQIIDLSGDATMKAVYSGGIYSIGFPEAAIDGFVIGYGTYFVEYLRECFLWGGFPGFKDVRFPPRKELLYLTKDLLPI